jgi:hypothetical protein
VRRIASATIATFVPVLATGCIAPFSEMHGARLTGQGRVEATPFYSAMYSSNDGETENVYNHLGAHLAFGMSEKVDFRVRIERVAVEGEPDDAFTVIGAGPKFALSRDRAALFLPVGAAFGNGLETSETVQFHPALLFTLPLNDRIELNPSIKALIPLNGDGGVQFAGNLGLAFGPDIRKWAIRPEVGMLMKPGEDGSALHASIGLSFATGR